MTETEPDQQTTLEEFQEADVSASLADAVERNAEDIEQLRSILGDTVEQINQLADAVGDDTQPADRPLGADGSESRGSSMFQ